jgi:hypothetical protein
LPLARLKPGNHPLVHCGARRMESGVPQNRRCDGDSQQWDGCLAQQRRGIQKAP